jgi:hypothetical protein
LNKKNFNDVRQKTMDELRQDTSDTTAYLREQGYRVVELWECQWNAMKKQNADLRTFITGQCRQPMDKVLTLTDNEVLQAIMQDKLFGMVECDIEVPQQLRSYFSEMQPIFKNAEISKDDIGDTMKDYAEQHNIMSQPRRSLIGSFFGKNVLLATPLLKWYVSHGLLVTKVYEVISYTPKACFEGFGNSVSTARRAGDADPDKAVVAETMKLLGNSGYGKTVTNKEKHKNTKFCNEAMASKFINNPFFRQLNPLGEGVYEVELSKKVIKLDLPLHIGFFVYQYAKLRMLEFYYDFLSVYVNRKDFQLCEMDTDSYYLALSAPSLEDVVRPEKRDTFYKELHKWLPADSCEQHRQEYLEHKCQGLPWIPKNPCCIAQKLYDKRTPGLFKVEWEGQGIIGLCSKTYYCFGSTDKYSSKGLSKKQNDFNKDSYLQVLNTQKSGHGCNRGFRVLDNTMYTYSQIRDGLTYFYPKRQVQPDGISTLPLEI